MGSREQVSKELAERNAERVELTGALVKERSYMQVDMEAAQAKIKQLEQQVRPVGHTLVLMKNK